MANDIRAVLIPIESGRKLLLPNAMVAEVMAMRSIDDSDNPEPWILGSVSWRGWDLPLIDFGLLTGYQTDHDHELKNTDNIAILKCINHPQELPYFAVLSRGIPKLQVVSRGDIQLHEEHELSHHAIASLVSIQDEMADIPNMNYLETQLISLTGEPA